MNKTVKLCLVLFAPLVSGLCWFGLSAPTAEAVTGSQWKAGHITDDGVFFYPNTISAQDIQNFFNSKVPECDSDGSELYSGSTTRAQYGTSRGYPPPYICLKDYSQSIPGKSPDSYCPGSVSAGTKSAAQIVWDVSAACGINPKVLIVLLQKEQSLVTDEWPWPIQYRSATGYGCPDTAPCDAEYYGFFNQVYMAARQFKRYAALPELYNFAGGRTSFVQYNPNSGCGGTNVTMVNQSTAGLYNYTPYQPNQAALNNLYGSGDSCSAYGNRNYWRLFHDWFGTTYAPNYSWQFIGQYAYTDQTKTTPVDLTKLIDGQRVYIGFQAKNMGNMTWTNSGGNPVRVGASNPFDRSSPFCDATWLSCARPANMIEASVAPGSTATFEFWYKPSRIGTFNEYFRPLVEGVQWMNDTGMYFHTIVQPKIYSWSIAGQYAYTDQTKSTPVDLTNLTTGQRVFIGFQATNSGNMTWTNSGGNPVRAGTSTPLDRASAFCDPTWLSCNRPVNMLEASVPPGSAGTFEFWYKAPSNTGTFNEHFRPLVEGVQWMNDTGLNYRTMVRFTAGISTLNPNQSLTSGQSLTSSNNLYKLVMQGDGNLVLYSINRALWSTRTSGKPATKVVMQDDGNLVLYDAQNKPYWHTSTAGRGSSRLAMQEDGNLVVYDSANRPTWLTGTNGQL